MRSWYLLLGLSGLATSLVCHAYETPPPKFLTAEVIWRNPLSGQVQTNSGQLWFADMPVRDAQGRISGFGRPGHYQGIKWFTPKNPGDIWLARAPATNNPQLFVLRDYCGERPVQLAFDSITLARTADAQLEKLLDQSISAVAGASATTNKALSSALATELDEISGEAPVMAAPVTATAEAAPGSAGPVHFATKEDLRLKSIAVSNLVKIVFLGAADGYQREVYGGRYVQFSQQAKGDNGRVQVAAATFFGGAAPEETLFYGGFRSDGSILAAGNYRDLDFLDRSLVRVLGTDPAPGAYPSVERTDPQRNRTWWEHPGQAPVLAHYSADLQKLQKVTRLPWGTGNAYSAALGADGSLYLAGWCGPHFGVMSQQIPTQVVANPEALKPDAKGRRREPGPDGFVLKLSADLSRLDWAVRFENGAANIFVRPDGSLLCRRGEELFYVDARGTVTAGPRLEIGGSNMALDPKSGAMYFGGSYRSATGLEPYVNPYLYKVDANGKQVWTAYGWTGPIVGVDQLRLVADSSVTSIRVGEDGKLTLTAWSDGGNTVLGQQPYDLRQAAKCGGFCSSTWGARGGLTVRIAHLIQMDPETMEVPAFTRYVGYLPTSDIPTLINIYDMHRLPNGEVAVNGGGWTGFVESQDAWITPWYIEHQTDEFAMAKGGPFFTLFSSDFNRVRMATIVPGVSGLRLAGQGQWLLLYGGAHDLAPGETDQKWRRRFPTIIRSAVQPKNGGGRDGYLMLINTQGEPNPPVIPPRSWGATAQGRGR